MTEAPPSDYGPWLTRYFPAYVTAELAEHHHDFWRWAWGVGGAGSIPPLERAGTTLGHILQTAIEDAETAINGHKGYSANVEGEEIVVSGKDGSQGQGVAAEEGGHRSRRLLDEASNTAGDDGCSNSGNDEAELRFSRPFVAIWPRGGAKSTSAELAVVAMAARGRRRYCLYVSRTQEQADDHVANVGQAFTTPGFVAAYPVVGARGVNKYGVSRGWRRNRLHTNSGFVIDALGLDTAARGAKVDEQRPDLIILDDIDKPEDTVATTDKLVGLITKAILPAGANDVAILAIQNLVHSDGVFARLANPDPPFLRHRTLSGPVRAVRDALLDGQSLISGIPTWPGGQSLETCQRQIDEWGLDAWLAEAQHEVGLQARVGLVMDGVDARDIVRDPPIPWHECLWRVVAIDPGGGDSAVMLADGYQWAQQAIGDRDGGYTEWRPSHTYWVYRPGQGMSAADMHRQLQTWHREGPIDLVAVGETGGDTIMRDLAAYGWRVVKANMDRSQIPEMVAVYKAGLATISLECWPEFDREWRSWWWKDRMPGANPSRSDWVTVTGAGHHADVSDAKRYSLATVKDGLPVPREQRSFKVVIR